MTRRNFSASELEALAADLEEKEASLNEAHNAEYDLVVERTELLQRHNDNKSRLRLHGYLDMAYLQVQLLLFKQFTDNPFKKIFSNC